MADRRRDLLAEIGTEELPPRGLERLAGAFADAIRLGLDGAGLGCGAVEPFATPRRIAVIARRIPGAVPGRTRERRGPALAAAFGGTGQPTRAALGFARSCGVEVGSLGRLETKKGAWLVHRTVEPPRPAADFIPGVVDAALAELPIARRMRWGDGDAEFVRPVHWVVLLLGGEVVDTTLLGVRSGRETRGHRFHHPAPIRLADAGEYVEKLRRPGRVIAPFGERRRRVEGLVADAAKGLGGRAVMDGELLDEVTALVEWPVAVAGRFEERFLALPRGVVTATLQGHQRYFPVEEASSETMPLADTKSGEAPLPDPGESALPRPAGPNGTRPGEAAPAETSAREARPAGRKSERAAAGAAPPAESDAAAAEARDGSGDGKEGGDGKEARLRACFVTIANLESRRPDAVRAGNERVIRPRLQDAEFFIRSDLERPLADYRPALEGVVFQEKLGSLGAKSERVARLVRRAARAAGLDDADTAAAVRAAELSKCDLVTAMVGEFPDLQGYMGACYARESGEGPRVAEAIEEAYLPRFAGDALPRSPAGRALALADRLDTLAGIFGIGLAPTGDRDPFALRRSALGVLRILVECEIDADLEALLRQAVEGYGGLLDAGRDRLAAEVFEFTMERLRGWTEAPADVFAAVHARRPVRPLDFVRRMNAVASFRSLPEAAGLAAANKRIVNLLRQVAEIDPKSPHRRSEVDEALFNEPAEAKLAARVAALAPDTEAMLARGDYTGAMTALAGLRAVVDEFFDRVQVMTDDPAVRANRLALLARIADLFLATADVSRLRA